MIDFVYEIRRTSDGFVAHVFAPDRSGLVDVHIADENPLAALLVGAGLIAENSYPPRSWNLTTRCAEMPGCTFWPEHEGPCVRVMQSARIQQRGRRA